MTDRPGFDLSADTRPSLHLEGWAPDYGAPFDAVEEVLDPSKVDCSVEVPGAWDPLPGRDDGVAEVLFVDGIRRVDARVALDQGTGPIPGLCGSFAVGAVRWDRRTPRAEVVESRVTRMAVFCRGAGARIPVAGPQLVYHTESVPDDDPGMLIQHFHGAMREGEAALAETLAKDGHVVVADGPINRLSATDMVGYIKTHRVPYLPPERLPIIGRLAPGERTPLFMIGEHAYRRYSWYLRLAVVPGGHSWSGVVRCESAAVLPRDTAVTIADRTAALLPRVASEGHVDARAPQNLVPIAGLERELRRLLGEPRFIHRKLREAIVREAA